MTVTEICLMTELSDPNYKINHAKLSVRFWTPEYLIQLSQMTNANVCSYYSRKQLEVDILLNVIITT
jgi:hypothetical protein